MQSVAKIKIEFTEKEIQKLGVSGVPFYIVNNKYGVSGAQLTESFIAVFNEVAATGDLRTGESCDIQDKTC